MPKDKPTRPAELRSFGSGFATTSGLLLNNYMDAFAKPGKRFGLDPSPANLLGPRKRPITSMVPTMLTKHATPSKLVGAFGASGGLPGISAMAQVSHIRRKGPQSGGLGGALRGKRESEV